MSVMLVNKIISSIMQIILFSLIPLIWWLITARKKESFFKWIGLKKIEKENKKSSAVNMLVIAIGYLIVSFITIYLIKDIETATSEFDGMGINALLPALIYAIFNTSLPEEILFRGFLLKRIANQFGYMTANIIQSMIFGLLHGLMFFNVLGAVKTIIIIFFTGMIAFAMGYINEKKANGSILPSWFIHALSNIFASIVAMFSLI
ncbi:CPBP family intramembrane glutamic endopeptidase [Traorella massiliensis]|uniref:CPBP family intramembrane glutamic endopeptidase n=1 Tax=Traorella massiliensis TaxID=1903263 RepID=UPI000ABB9758|nr:CPBP family intramembrane glutamic endopeptidase [Traorella massiliensis]